MSTGGYPAAPCQPTGRRPRPGYRTSRLVRHRRVRMRVEAAGASPPPTRPYPGGMGAHPAPARSAPEPWYAGTHRAEPVAPERGDRAGLIAAVLVTVVVVAALAVGGTYLWRRHTGRPVASPAACAVAAQTIAQATVLPPDPVAAAAWRDERDAAHQLIAEDYLSAAVDRYTWMAVRIVIADPVAPTDAERAAVARELRGHCRADLTVGWPAP